MSARRPAVDMLKDARRPDFKVESTDPPVTKGMGFLATETGPRLEMMTRTNRAIVSGVVAASAYVARYNSSYIDEKRNSLMRLAISNGGLGRSEMIQMVSAGGQMSDAYYDKADNRQADYPVEGDY